MATATTTVTTVSALLLASLLLAWINLRRDRWLDTTSMGLIHQFGVPDSLPDSRGFHRWILWPILADPAAIVLRASRWGIIEPCLIGNHSEMFDIFFFFVFFFFIFFFELSGKGFHQDSLGGGAGGGAGSRLGFVPCWARVNRCASNWWMYRKRETETRGDWCCKEAGRQDLSGRRDLGPGWMIAAVDSDVCRNECTAGCERD